MMYRTPRINRICAFLLFSGLLLFLFLLVVVPVQAQNPIPPPPTSPDVNATQYPVDAPKALLLFLGLQIVLLLIFLVSYMVDPKRMQRLNDKHLSERWYGFLHLPH